jgi:hypothetical protein
MPSGGKRQGGRKVAPHTLEAAKYREILIALILANATPLAQALVDRGLAGDVAAPKEINNRILVGLIKRGGIGSIRGFDIIISDVLAGGNTIRYHIIAGTKDWLTVADGLKDGPEELRLEADFATGYRDLRIYGAKVADEKRKFAVHLLRKSDLKRPSLSNEGLGSSH